MTSTLHNATQQIDFGFHEGAGSPKHGPSLDKPQTKLWRAFDAWWALLARDNATAEPEFAIFELVTHEDVDAFRDTGVVVASDRLLTADVHFDGTQLWIATRAPEVGISLLRYFPDEKTRTWTADPAGSWRLADIASPSITVTSGNDNTVWLSYTDGSCPWYVTGSIDSFPALSLPAPIPGALPTLIDVDLGALVTLDDGVGLFWSDQGLDAFYFAIAHNDGSWTTETPGSGGRVADDHIAIRQFEGRLYVATKTSRDSYPDASDGSLFLLFVRETDGTWHDHHIAHIDEDVTRPIPMIEPGTRQVHVFYTYGPNPGERSIRRRTASLSDLQFSANENDIVLRGDGAQINDVTSSRELLDNSFGGVVLASDGANRRYYFRRVMPGEVSL